MMCVLPSISHQLNHRRRV